MSSSHSAPGRTIIAATASTAAPQAAHRMGRCQRVIAVHASSAEMPAIGTGRAGMISGSTKRVTRPATSTPVMSSRPS